MIYRNPDLLALARRAPHCMACGKPNVDDVVMAHSNQLRDGKGRGLKAHDFRVAATCGQCHHEIDQGSTLTRDERVTMWEAAHRATLEWLFTAGWLVVAAEPTPLAPQTKDKRSWPKRKMPRTGRKIPSRKMRQ